VLTHRGTWLAILGVVLLSGCSTALFVDSPYDDDLTEQDATAPFDASARADASTVDARVDAGRDAAQDAGRDAAVDAGRLHDCTVELPQANFASLLTNGCATRQPTLSCVGQVTLDNRMDFIARKCGLPQAGRPADLGFVLGSEGCATFFLYDQAFVRGAISGCIQNELEQVRFDCWSAQCGVVHYR
jgi:hypothetical protein